jgi:hypothetical protein
MDCSKSPGRRIFYALCLIFMMSACSETDDVASALLYQDDGETETGSVSFNMREVGQWDLGNGNILYGIDMQVINTLNDRAAEDIRLTLEQVNPESFVADFSSDRREIEFLAASQNRVFDEYWCFNCGSSAEVRVGNYFVIISKDAGAGRSYSLRFDGRYEVESNRTDVGFSRSIVSVEAASSAPL